MNRKRIALTLAAAATALAFGTVAASAAQATATASVNVRSGPGVAYRVVDVLHRGERVDVDSCRGAWCHVRHPGPDGWVSANYLTRGVDRWNDRHHVYPPRPPVHHYNHHRPIHPHYPYHPFGSFCVGGQHSSFCIGGY